MTRSSAVISPEDKLVLAQAYEDLEHPSLAVRVSSVLGAPVQEGLNLLPPSWYENLNNVTEAAIDRALQFAVWSLGQHPPEGAHDGAHRLMAMGAGAVGGFFGLPALLVELPVTTVLMLRAIADVAHAEGEDLTDIETRLACVEVFALGGRSHADDAAEIGYYELRAALALHFSMAASEIARHGVSSETLPASVNLARAIAARFGVVISDKAAAQAVPVVGATGGAVVNAVFMRHFEDVARGHFSIRRLERQYGEKPIEAAYRALKRRAQTKRRRIRRRRLA